MNRYEEEAEHEGAIFERSIFSSRTVFIERDKVRMNPEATAFLRNLSRFGEQKYEKDAHVIYLTVSPEEMFRRVTQRDRPSERSITLVLI
jgi:deoxyadenosine/deoxycytidine kinase